MTEQEYKDKIRAEEIAKGPNNRFSLFHPVGGRQVFNPDEPGAIETLKKLEAQGWCESPLEFWDADTTAEKTAVGFFNAQKPVPASYRPDAKTPRGGKAEAVSGQPGDLDSGSGPEHGGETVLQGGDTIPAKRGRSGSKGGSKKKAAVVS